MRPWIPSAASVFVVFLIFFSLRPGILADYEVFAQKREKLQAARQLQQAFQEKQRQRNQELARAAAERRNNVVPQPHSMPEGSASAEQGVPSVPPGARVWDEAGQYDYVPPAGCEVLHVAAWGAGGGGASSANNVSYGGGGAYAYQAEPVNGNVVTITVGRGGGAGVRASRTNDIEEQAVGGKGGQPYGGSGGTSRFDSGGGGGGASLAALDQHTVLIAGGGGGGGTASSGVSGSAYHYAYEQGGSTGQSGVGGKALDQRVPGLNGEEFQGGTGDPNNGSGGGGGGYGGGSGGNEGHGGGGGGSLGSIVIGGALRAQPELSDGPERGWQNKRPWQNNPYRLPSYLEPGNPHQAIHAGFGGAPLHAGQDGKVIVWCGGKGE